MNELQRATTEYIDSEDRLRLSGTVDGQQTVVLWLTHRLLQRLLPPLLTWLDKRQPDAVPRADVLHSFAQQQAQSKLPRQAPVQAKAESQTWLVTSIDITSSDQAVRLIFKGRQQEAAQLTLTPIQLRQWLGILHAGYRAAQWPLDAWPVWMAEGTAIRPPPAALLH